MVCFILFFAAGMTRAEVLDYDLQRQLLEVDAGALVGGVAMRFGGLEGDGEGGMAVCMIDASHTDKS